MRKKVLIGFCTALLVMCSILGLVACKHDHTWGVEWQADETYHWYGCTKKNCKETHEKAEHTFTQDKDEFSHWKECEICGYISGKENHNYGSDLRCTTCGAVHEHKVAYDDKIHYYACVGCDKEGQSGNHTFVDGVCNFCKYVQGTKELVFEKNSDYTYKVIGINVDIENPVRNIVIPEYYNGGKVTVIGASAFYGNHSLNKITLPSTLTTIENSAFAMCSGLAEIVIPKSVTKIGSRVFEDCYGITIKAETKSVPSGWNTSDWQINQYCELPVVWDCLNNDKTASGDIYFLNEIAHDYTKSVKYVIKGDVAYVAKQPRILKDSTNLNDRDRDFVEFKTNVLYNDKEYKVVGVEDFAFYNYESITEVELKATFSYIGDYAFEGCTNLKVVNWVKNHDYDVDISIGLCAFRNAISLTKIDLPDNVDDIKNKVVKIGGYAFSGCTRLKEIKIPSSVREVKEGAFEDCLSLVIKCVQPTMPATWDIEWNSSGCPVIWDCNTNNTDTEDGKIVYSVGTAVYLLDTETLTATLLSQGELSDDYKDYVIVSEVNYDSKQYTLTAIGASAFADDKFFTSITIPASVKTIGDYAFSNCEKLDTITFAGNQIISIGANAFENCSSLVTFEFAGTKAEWEAIAKGNNWDINTGEYSIKLGDGATIKKGSKEN